jgi:hypothetical protein
MKIWKNKLPGAVEKNDGVFCLKPHEDARAKHAEDLALLAKGGLKVEDLAIMIARLMERVKDLEGSK